ncbi:MAG: MBL fold metallo-hydrolase, partial [Thermoanaerobaculia bacterium]|nr:MBL fold metallo-hydrolase [Thermoanaerobaculia bacterium]
MTSTLAFHGAARTVTGSKYLLETAGERTLIDAGLFQGLKELRLLNWEDPPFQPQRLDRILLTHTHIDHIGFLPRLVRRGFDGPVLTTRATVDLARLLLLDSARLQEEDAAYANRKGFSRHRPAEPLYTERDAEAALRLLEVVDYDRWIEVGAGLHARFQNAGHILGSASIEMRLPTGSAERRLVFSGDIGRYGSPLHPDPEPLPDCDVLIVESTYGDRDHDTTPVDEQMRLAVHPTLESGGTVLVPAFAVGRTQQVVLVLRELMNGGRLPTVPIHIDSPMAVDATRIYSRHLDAEHVDAEIFADGRERLFPHDVQLHSSVDDSKRLNDLDGPRIIVSASGMLSGGRVLHHLVRLLPRRGNLVLMAGFQAAGTRGRKLLEGRRTLRVHGADIPVRAECVALHGLSAHGDRGELERWMTAAGARPNTVYV